MVTEKMKFAAVGSSVDLPELEHGVLELWERERSFDALRKKNAGGPRFSFYDGPITANVEAMGIHHAWSRTYKDLYQRYQAMLGKDQRYQNGFDCQGLWVEVQVERELNLNSKRDIESYGIDRFSDACRARVDRSAAAITKQSIRLGQWMDWDNSYFTYADNNISHIWHVLKICQERGWLYKGHRSMPWCARCGTALSQHEMIDSYREMTHTSIYAKLPIEGKAGEFFLVWTTTPWTLPAHVALAVHPELDYVRVGVDGEVLVLSKGTLDTAVGAERILRGEVSLLETVKGRDLVGLRYRGPFDDLPATAPAKAVHRVIEWDAVSEEEGTGIVHIAPGCGAEDFALSKTESLPVLVPIDDSARFVRGYGWLEGKGARDVAQEIADDLKTRGFLFRAAPYTHRYPVCWRCKEEIVFRVDDEWFIAMDELRPQLMAAAKDVNWVPAAAGARMQNWLQNMGDWNISRKRYWGLPLPFYTCANGHFFVLGSEEELRTHAIRGLEGLRDLHRPWIDAVVVGCPTCNAESKRVKEVGDCWLDAGVVPFSTLDWLHDRAYWEQWFPADFVVEMVEQVRLWFYSALFFSVVLAGRAPYRTNGSHAVVLAAPGEEFHKTGANMLDLGEACEEVGADVIRWVYTRQNPQENVYWGGAPTDDIKRRLLTLWNTYSFFVTYANLDGFDPNASEVPATDRPLIDRWLLSALARLVRECREALDRYDSATAAYKMEAFWGGGSVDLVRTPKPAPVLAGGVRDRFGRRVPDALRSTHDAGAPVRTDDAVPRRSDVPEPRPRFALRCRGVGASHVVPGSAGRADRRWPGAADARRDASRRPRPCGAFRRRSQDTDATAEAHRGLRQGRSRSRRARRSGRARGRDLRRAECEGLRGSRPCRRPGQGDREARAEGARPEAWQGSPTRTRCAAGRAVQERRWRDRGRGIHPLSGGGARLARGHARPHRGQGCRRRRRPRDHAHRRAGGRGTRARARSSDQ